MGLIILPLLAAWIAAAVYSGFMGYAVINGGRPLWYGAMFLVLGVLLALLYVRIGLASFKAKETVWAFEIPLSFLLNKVAIGLYVVAALWYFSGWRIPAFTHTAALCFVVSFSVAAGTLIAVFYADRFQKQHGIETTY